MKSCLRLLLPLAFLLQVQPLAPAPAGGRTFPSADLIGDALVKQKVYHCFSDLYCFDFQSARKEALELERARPSSPWPGIMKACCSWWDLISGETGGAVKASILSELNNAEKKIHNVKNGEHLYCKIIINSLRSRYYMYLENYFAVFHLLRQSHDLLEETHGLEEVYEPFLLTRGLFQYFHAAAREKMNFLGLLSRINIHTSKATGLECLRRLSSSADPILSTEGHYFLMKIYLELENQPEKACAHASFLSSKYPQNSIFSYYYLLTIRALPAGSLSDQDLHAVKERVLHNQGLSEKQKAHLSGLFLKLKE